MQKDGLIHVGKLIISQGAAQYMGRGCVSVSGGEGWAKKQAKGDPRNLQCSNNTWCSASSSTGLYDIGTSNIGQAQPKP